ncbi:hypothetical protein CPB83DRAFT_900732 [Crepidotus variabilis]|uniref:Uncharacterized protein n=1 Tax=Crepidotus variabilis TaxID=179855 RepID=A0A9P6BBQ0_9AGAR|nr:hypothetical protein CPB83DRAFT_900732 [Crepidotus variabilis]
MLSNLIYDHVTISCQHIKLQTLVLETILWDSLKHHIEKAWPFASDNSLPRREGGLCSLISDVAKALATRPGHFVLDAADYFPGFASGEADHTISHQRRCYSAITSVDVHTRVVEIVCQWLQLPDPRRFYPRAWFVIEMVKSVGPHSLRLDFVQHAAFHLNAEILGIGKNKRIERCILSTWFTDHLLHHPASDPLSEVGKAIVRISGLLEPLCPLHASVMQELSVMSTNNQDPLPQPSQSFTSTSNQPNDSSNPVQCASYDNAVMQRLFRLLEALYPTVDGLDATSDATDKHLCQLHNAFLQSVVAPNVVDQRLPFRNLAPSRKRILEVGGPYSPQHCSTISGFFSALLYKGITHSTPFLLEQKTLFVDLEDYRRTCAGLVDKETSYFCNVSAFGRGNSRSASHVDAYWKIAQNKELNSWLFSESPHDFLSVFNLLSKAKIPAFGLLTTAQLVVDYAECGKVTYPSAQDMAHIIWRLKMGGLTGLATLGYTVETPEDVVKALETLVLKLGATIPRNIQKKIGFGVIFVEHLLCKFGRLDKIPFKKYEKYLIASTSSS